MASTAREEMRISEKPTTVRYWVIFFAVTLSIVTYIDRVALSLSRGKVAADLHLSDTQMGAAFVAFAPAYSVFEIPSGWMGDKWGPRSVLMRIVVWWSGVHRAYGTSVELHLALRDATALRRGRGGLLPEYRTGVLQLAAAIERVRAQGIIWLSARWGGAFTPLLVAFLFRFMSWRQAFCAFGILGVIWAVAFYVWFRDDPRDKAGVNAAELDLLKYNAQSGGHGSVPWAKFAQSRTVWLLCAQYFALSFPWYFLITWAPTFIDERFHVDVNSSMWLKTLPLLMCGIGSMFSGMISAPLTRWTGSIVTTRRILGCTGFLGAALSLVWATTLHQPLIGVLAIGLSAFCNDLVMPTAWGTVMDVAGHYSGTLAGTMNMMGNLGGAVYGPAVGVVLSLTGHNWNWVLFMGAAVYLTGFFMWMVIDPVTPIDRDDVVRV